MKENNFENQTSDQDRQFEAESKENLIRKIEELEAANEDLAEKNKELAAEKTRLEDLATKDPLTELYNRRGFAEAMAHIMPETRPDNEARENPKHKAGSVLMIDIDDFKKINDVYGHNVGDEILRQAAKFLEENIRKTDIICRWGGEEFVIFLQNIDAKKVIQKFYNKEKGRAQIGFTATVNGKNIPITFSGGASEIAHGKDIKKIIDDTVDKADEQLYSAKKDGKNKIYRPEENKR